MFILRSDETHTEWNTQMAIEFASDEEFAKVAAEFDARCWPMFTVRSWKPTTPEEIAAHTAYPDWLLDAHGVRVAPHNGIKRVLLWRIHPVDHPELELWVRADAIDAP